MEYGWYLAPGQTLENTKISQRGLALRAPAKEWKRITDHLDRSRSITEAQQKENERKKKMKSGSHALVKEWPDCSQNTHVRLVEERKRREDELEQSRMKEYLEIRKEQEEIKEEYIKKVKKSMYHQKPQSRQLNGALQEAEAICGREKQKEFRKLVQEQDREEERKFAQQVKEQAEEERREYLEKAQALHKKKQEIRETYLKEIETRTSREAESKRNRAEKELQDGVNANIELATQEKMKREDAMKTRAERKSELLGHIRQRQEIKREMEKEEANVEEAAQIFNEAKHRIDCIRKEKNEEIRNQLLILQDIVSKKAVSDQKEKDDTFERILTNAQEEQLEKDEKKRQRDVEKLRQLRQDVEENRNAFFKREEKERLEAEELKKWQILNRQKKDELCKKHNEEQRRKQVEKAQRYQQELLKQIEENKSKTADDADLKSAADAYVAKKLETQDKEFFAYADEVLENCKRKGLTTYPIEKVIKNYRVQNNMNVPSRDCEPVEENEARRRGKMLNNQPGKMCHDPREDPTYCRCKHCKYRVIG